MVYWINYAFSTISEGPETSYIWRVPTIMQCIFLLPMVVLIFLIPETPRWLAGHDRNEECFEVLRRMHKGKMTEAEVKAEYDMIVGTVALETSAGASSWKDLLRSDGRIRTDTFVAHLHLELTYVSQSSTRAEGSSSLAEFRFSNNWVASML